MSIITLLGGRRSRAGWDASPAGDNPYRWPTDADQPWHVPAALDDVWAEPSSEPGHSW
jgi:hypothetical protein